MEVRSATIEETGNPTEMKNPKSAVGNPKCSQAPIDALPSRHPERDYEIRIVAPEFTAVCPRTGQPDFATLTLTYVPSQHCLELKSFKMYLQSFRNRGIFHEHVTNEILNDLVKSCSPRKMTLV